MRRRAGEPRGQTAPPGKAARSFPSDRTAQRIQLEIPASAAYLYLARLFVGEVASLEGGFSHERIDNLRLAVSEACTNAIAAHSRIGSTEPIRIGCSLAVDRIEVDVVDHGPGFDPTQIVPLPPVTDPHRLDFERGLGLRLMRELTDGTEIRSGPSGTEVRLVMRAGA